MEERIDKLNSQAISLAGSGLYTEAIACFKRALVVDNSNHFLWFNLGITYKDAGDTMRALQCLEKAIELSPGNHEIIETLAAINFNTGNFEAAVHWANEGLELNPMNANLWNTIGVVFFNTSQYIEAAEAFEHALTINPYYYDALFNLRDTYDELGNKTGKEECSNRLRQLKFSQQDYNA